MSTFNRALLAAALLLAAPVSVEADGIQGLSARAIGEDGITAPIVATGPPPTDCPADGLDFTDACGTTQYMMGL